MSNDNYFIDPRDSQKYKTVKIGDQIWMAENLSFNAPGSKYYNNDPKYIYIYGRLYDWNMAMKVCPPGWHLPTNEEWDELIKVVGGKDIAAKHLKAKSGWQENGNGLDTYGFAALPGGTCIPEGKFHTGGGYGGWWSASGIDASDDVYYQSFNYKNYHAGCFNCNKGLLFSIRYVKDD